jgi:hypothetical protein
MFSITAVYVLEAAVVFFLLFIIFLIVMVSNERAHLNPLFTCVFLIVAY